MLLWGHGGGAGSKKKGEPASEFPSENLKRVEDWIARLGVTPSEYDRYRAESEDIQKLSDGELVYVARLGQSFGAGEELTRRNTQAIVDLQTALGKAEGRLYGLTRLLTLYTVLIAILTVVLIFHR